VDRVRAVRDAGLPGIKLHPYYQDFDLADESMFALYAALEEQGLLVVCHTGFDLAFERIRRADPKRILTVLERFPKLRLVTTHLGAWEDWDEAYTHLIGKPIYLETSFAISYLGRDKARRILLEHPPDRLLFGSDSPWAGQRESMDELRALGLPAALERQLFRDNARRLLAGSDRAV
jgi:predicted TIM-barrel fold metal-dependent hydrolase